MPKRKAKLEESGAEQLKGFGQAPLPAAASAPGVKGAWMFTNYVPLRRGLEEHARSGKGFGLTHEEGWAFTLILIRTDCETGLWRGSAKALLPYNWQHRKAKKILTSLVHKGYLKRFCKPRQRGNYFVAVDKYGVTRGPHRGLIVDAKQSTSPETMVYRVPEGGPVGVPEAAPSQEVRTKNKKGEEEKRVASLPDPSPPQRMFKAWFVLSGDLPKARELTPKREQRCKSLMKKHNGTVQEFMINWQKAIVKAASTPFLLGESDKGWTATFDWMIKGDNYIKVLEGNYDGKARNSEQQEETCKCGKPVVHGTSSCEGCLDKKRKRVFEKNPMLAARSARNE